MNGCPGLSLSYCVRTRGSPNRFPSSVSALENKNTSYPKTDALTANFFLIFDNPFTFFPNVGVIIDRLTVPNNHILLACVAMFINHMRGKTTAPPPAVHWSGHTRPQTWVCTFWLVCILLSLLQLQSFGLSWSTNVSFQVPEWNYLIFYEIV